MAKFIEIGDTYDARTGDGKGKKLINTDQIVYITVWEGKKRSPVKGIKARIKLSNGEEFDVRESISEIAGCIAQN